jgi:hypothetical protein
MEILTFVETNENGNTTYQKQWDTTKALLCGKSIAIITYTKYRES